MKDFSLLSMDFIKPELARQARGLFDKLVNGFGGSDPLQTSAREDIGKCQKITLIFWPLELLYFELLVAISSLPLSCLWNTYGTSEGSK